MITGNAVLFPDSVFAGIDPLVIALPLSIIAMTMSLFFFRTENKAEPSSV